MEDASRSEDAPLAATHKKIWAAMDSVAQSRSMSPSALAKVAGLDATAFNPSKRVSRDGRLRWPSVETLAKVLAVTNLNFAGFARIIDGDDPAPGRQAPIWRLTAEGLLEDSGVVDRAPETDDPDAFWIDLQDDEVGDGVYLSGDKLLISPNAPQEIGARVAFGLAAGRPRLGRLSGRDDTGLELSPLSPLSAAFPQSFGFQELNWTGRIIWARQ